MTIEEVAHLLSVSTSTVRRWISSGKLEGKKAGAQWRFDRGVVQESFELGVLSGASKRSSTSSSFKYRELREDERLQIMQWRDFILDHLGRNHPSHVVVVDRRGAKLWTMMEIEGFRWGENLWHSSAIEQMTPREQRRFFDAKTVLLFDDLLESGQAMQELRRYLEFAGATVDSLVCVRNLSRTEAGEVVEIKASACEDLDEKAFSERVTLVSRLVSFFELPLDVDHLIVKAGISPGLTIEDMLDRLSKWGQTFIVWHPRKKGEYLAVTLDRPQFLEASSIYLPKGFSLDWRAPCKVRLYILPEEGICYCSFIAYPAIQASEADWAREVANLYQNTQLTFTNPPTASLSQHEASVRAIYWRICMDLAMKLFGDFVTSGAAEDVGIRFQNFPDAFDASQLRAAFGPSLGTEIVERTRRILVKAKFRESLFRGMPQDRVPLKVRKGSQVQGYSYDVFACRMDLLKAVPQRHLIGASDRQAKPISYGELFDRLPAYSESTIGKSLDNELDKATLKPVIQTDYVTSNGTACIIASRGFTRGEFGIWFELDTEPQTYDDKAMQRALTLGAVVVEDYLKRTKGSDMTATEFNKVFANIQHDWSPVYDLVHLGWKPYKFGPIPIIPDVSASGQYLPYHRFLVDKEVLSETREQHESKTWSRFRLNSTSKIPWRRLYEQKTSAITRAYVAQLTRIYAKIQQDCKTVRLSDPRSSGMSAFRDPLVVLATARNKATAYICCWYEFDDWKRKGRALFPHLEGAVLAVNRPSEPYMKRYLEDFASPAKILFDKIEMYRNIPYLRKQIEGLRNQGDFEVAEVLLERIDAVPQFESNSKFPIKNLEYACGVMRAFSSMTRQILTRCGLDADERKAADKLDNGGSARDESSYCRELLSICPELRSKEADLQACIESARSGVFTESVQKCLSKTFQLILTLFEKQELIPDPRPTFELNRENRQRREGLNIRLQEIPISGPYAVAVADVMNLINLASFADVFGITYDEALDGLLDWVKASAEEAAKNHRGVALCGLPADDVVIAGSNVDDVYSACLDLINGTTKHLSTMDRQLIPFSPLRVGIAWREESLGEEFKGIKPGLTAYLIAEARSRSVSTISITKAVHDRLAPLHQKAFVGNNGSCGQGEVFVRDCKSVP